MYKRTNQNLKSSNNKKKKKDILNKNTGNYVTQDINLNNIDKESGTKHW